MPNASSSSWSNGTSANLSNLFTSAINVSNWVTPNVFGDLFSMLRKNAVISVCPDCNDVQSPSLHKLKCEYCDKEYDGELALKKVTIAGEDLVVPVHEGKCSSCGCHNMDRISAVAKCGKCGCETIHYLPKHRPEGITITTDYTKSVPGTAADWSPYITVGSAPIYETTSTSASTMYTYASA